MNYDPTKVSDPEKLGIYYFNETTGKWEYVGGKVTDEGTIVFNVKHFSKYTAMEYRKTFNDINIPWAKNQIEVLAARHIISGLDNSSYGSNDNITRAAFAKLLVYALNLEQGANKVEFSDVINGQWYTEPVEIAASLGIVTGYEGKFNPNGEITREEMATMIVRALRNVNPNGDYTLGTTTFADNSNISSWAQEAVSIASGKGLRNGLDGNKFGPMDKATRAQSAVIIYRMLNMLDRL